MTDLLTKFPDQKFNIIYADPPWSFNSKKSGGSMKSGALNHYPTMNINDLKKMPVKELADDSCILFMWYVSSQPQEALDLIKAWGFKVKNMNGFVWNKLTKTGKPDFGMGYYTRAGAEMCAIATKGKAGDLIESRSTRQVQSFQRLHHSKKPDEFRDLIVNMCGDKPRLELFARNETDGWNVWGNEV